MEDLQQVQLITLLTLMEEIQGRGPAEVSEGFYYGLARGCPSLHPYAAVSKLVTTLVHKLPQIAISN